MNFLPVRPVEGGVRLASGDLVAIADAPPGFAAATLGIRPEHLRLAPTEGAGVASGTAVTETGYKHAHTTELVEKSTRSKSRIWRSKPSSIYRPLRGMNSAAAHA